jgi:hypothetical protein
MLAVVGSPSFAPGSMPGAAGDAGGLAAAIARVAAADGIEVQLIGKVGDDPSGDAVLLALGREQVGHLALLRDAGHATPIAPPGLAVADPADTEAIATLLGDDATTEEPPADAGTAAPTAGLAMEPADISLGLRYVRDFRVLVAADPLDGPSSLVIAEAAMFADAALIVVAPHGVAMPVAPASAIVLEAPETDPDGAFATLVGRLAAALDRGMDVGEAFGSATAQGGWERAGG